MSDTARRADDAAQPAEEPAHADLAETQSAVERLAALNEEQMKEIRERLGALLTTESAAASAPANLTGPAERPVEPDAHPPRGATVAPPAPTSVPPVASAAVAPRPLEQVVSAPSRAAPPAEMRAPSRAAPPAEMRAPAARAVPTAAVATAATTRRSGFSAASTVGRWVTAISAIVPYALVGLILRFVMAQVFFLYGQRQIEGPVYRLDVLGFDLSVMLPTSVKGSSYQMFEQLTNLPIPSWAAAPVVAYAAFILPIFLVLGFATRFSAFVLLLTVAAMQFVVGTGELWSLHICWMAILMVLISRGPGLISIDGLIRRFSRG